MTTLSLALESLSDPVTEQAVQYEFSIDEELHKLDNHFSLVTECYSVIDSIKKQEFISFEDYSGIKDWVYTKSAQLNIPVKLKIATETIASCQSLALEGIGDFFSAIWTAIKKMVAGIWEFLKRVFGASKKSSENTSRNLRRMEDEIRALMSKQKHFDQDKIKAYINSAVEKGELDGFKHVVLSDIEVSNNSLNSVIRHINTTLSQIKSVTDALCTNHDISVAKHNYIDSITSDEGKFISDAISIKLSESPEFKAYQELVRQGSVSIPNLFINGFYSNKENDAKSVIGGINGSIDLTKVKFLIFKRIKGSNPLTMFTVATTVKNATDSPILNTDVYKLSMISTDSPGIINKFVINKTPSIPIPVIDDVGYLVITLLKFIGDGKNFLNGAQTKTLVSLEAIKKSLGTIDRLSKKLSNYDNNIDILKENINIIKFLMMDGLSDANILTVLDNIAMEYIGAINTYIGIIQQAYTEGLK